MATPTVLQIPDLRSTYQALYDVLGRAYWDASDIASKDLIHGAQEAIGEIISGLNQQVLEDNTAAFLQLKPKIDATNEALKQIQKSITAITKNINTAASVLSAITKLLSLFP